MNIGKYQVELTEGCCLHDRYIIRSSVGMGGFGITYKAYDTKLNRTVAVKEHYPTLMVSRNRFNNDVIVSNEEYESLFTRSVERFLEEAKTSAKFNNSPYTVDVYDYFEENNTAYIVMEFLEGVSLKDYVKSGNLLDENSFVDVFGPVISALNTIHKAGVVHRDISPDNIFISDSNRIKVLDFGASMLFDDEKTKSILFKKGFAPPEQYESHGDLGPWTDIYALGATMYYCVTGKMPEASIDRELHDDLLAPQALNHDIPDYINKLILRCMALEPSIRFQSVSQIKSVIKNQRVVIEEKEQIFLNKRKRKISILVLASVFAVATVVMVIIWNNQRLNATFSGCEIVIWIPVNSGNSNGVLEDRLNAYVQDYPEVKLTVIEYSEDEYITALEDAAEKGNMPSVFLYTSECSEFENYLIELDETYNYISNNSIELYYKQDEKHISTGYDTVVIYKNIKADSTSNNSLESFLTGNEEYFVGGVVSYLDVQKKLVGNYELDTDLGNNEYIYTFVDTWVVSNGQDNRTQKAAQILLAYLVGDYSEEVFYIQNFNGIPNNESTMNAFFAVYPELKGISEYTSVMKPVSEEEMSTYTDEMYIKADLD